MPKLRSESLPQPPPLLQNPKISGILKEMDGFRYADSESRPQDVFAEFICPGLLMSNE